MKLFRAIFRRFGYAIIPLDDVFRIRLPSGYEGLAAVNALAMLEFWAKKGKVEIARSLLGKGFEVGHLATNSAGVGETVMDAIRRAVEKEGKP